MFLSWHTAGSRSQPAEKSSCAGTLVFEPPEVVRAIAFHLLDEKFARGVTEESCDAAMLALAELEQRLEIKKERWLVLTNRQRLEWLLKQSRIVVEANLDGTVSLRA